MRIALLSYEYPAETGFGGIGTYTRTQARALAAAGHEVEVLAGGAVAGSRGVEREREVTVHRLGDRPRPGAMARLLGALGWWWSRNRLENGSRMRRLLDEAEARAAFDLIELPDCGAEGLRLDPRGASRRVARFHSPAEIIMPFYPTRAGDRRLCAALERRALRRAATFSSCSRFLAAEAESRGLGRNVVTIPNGVEIDIDERPGRIDLRERLGLSAGRPVVLFSGRLEPRKGTSLLLDLVPELLRRREVAFVVVGDDLFGHGQRELAPRCAGPETRGSLHLLGRLSAPEIGSALAQADVVLVPSRWESCPYAVLEAMVAGGSGTAIAASRVGGVPELVSHDAEALLAATGDVRGHLDAVERLLDSRELRHRLGAAARRRAETEFSPRAIAERSLELYRQVVEKSPR